MNDSVLHTAIETVHSGFRFRSRLEARWAVFFEALGIEYRYEAEGYEVGEHMYLPDFYLPQFRAHVEVKGDPDGLIKDWARMSAVVEALPHFKNSGDPSDCTPGLPGLILLGDIPRVESGYVAHPVIRDRNGLMRDYFFFLADSNGSSLSLLDATDLSWVRLISGCERRKPRDRDNAATGWPVNSIYAPTLLAHTEVVRAYQAAQQARF